MKFRLKTVLEQTFFLVWFFSFYRNAMHEYLANLSVWKFPTAGKWKRKKITSKVGQRQIRHRIGFLKLFFSMPRPRRDGSTLTYFWLKCFITIALQFKEWNFLKYLKLWLTKNNVLMTFTYKADIEQHFDKKWKKSLGWCHHPKNSWNIF